MEAQITPSEVASLRDLCLQLMGKVDALISLNERKHEAQDQLLTEMRLQLNTHIAANGHAHSAKEQENLEQRVTDIETWKNLRQGNIDVLKVFFGTSIVSLLISAVSLAANLMK